MPGSHSPHEQLVRVLDRVAKARYLVWLVAEEEQDVGEVSSRYKVLGDCDGRAQIHDQMPPTWAFLGSVTSLGRRMFCYSTQRVSKGQPGQTMSEGRHPCLPDGTCSTSPS